MASLIRGINSCGIRAESCTNLSHWFKLFFPLAFFFFFSSSQSLIQPLCFQRLSLTLLWGIRVLYSCKTAITVSQQPQNQLGTFWKAVSEQNSFMIVILQLHDLVLVLALRIILLSLVVLWPSVLWGLICFSPVRVFTSAWLWWRLTCEVLVSTYSLAG